MVQGGLLTAHPGSVHGYGWSPGGGISFRHGIMHGLAPARLPQINDQVESNPLAGTYMHIYALVFKARAHSS